MNQRVDGKVQVNTVSNPETDPGAWKELSPKPSDRVLQYRKTAQNAGTVGLQIVNPAAEQASYSEDCAANAATGPGAPVLQIVDRG